MGAAENVPGSRVRVAADYEETLRNHFLATLPDGTTVSTKVTPYSVVCVVDVPHKFDQLERRPDDMPVQHCGRSTLHGPHRHRWFAVDDVVAERWCGGVS